MSPYTRPDDEEIEQRSEHSMAAFILVAVLVMGSLLLLSRFASGEEQPSSTEVLLATIATPEAATAPAQDSAQVAPQAALEPALSPVDKAATAVDAPAEATPSQSVEENIAVEALAAPSPTQAPAAATAKPAAPRASTPPPGVGARAYAIVERDCGALLWGKNEHDRLAPASLTKIVTALVVEEHASLGETVEIGVSGSQMAKRGSSVMGIEPGMEFSVRDLLYGLFLPSGNDAAIALAEHVGDGDVDDFIDMMNATAGRLGMDDSHFANPHGLDNSRLYSSALDMAIAGDAVLDDATLAKIASTPDYTPSWDGPKLRNGNKLLDLYPGAFGVKIGYTTNAKQTIVAAAERNGRQIIVSLFGSEDRYGETAKLLDWAFAKAPAAC